MRGLCQHFSDAERAISGTWVMVEIRVAVTKGYKVEEIHEVYEYTVTQYDKSPGEGGLFVEFQPRAIRIVTLKSLGKAK